MGHTARGSIHVEGLEMALIKQHTLETRQKQAENQNLGYLGWGKMSVETMWNYENLRRSF